MSEQPLLIPLTAAVCGLRTNARLVLVVFGDGRYRLIDGILADGAAGFSPLQNVSVARQQEIFSAQYETVGRMQQVCASNVDCETVGSGRL